MKSNFYYAGVCFLCAMFLFGCLSRQTISVDVKPQKKFGSAQFSRGTGESFDSAVVISGGKEYTEAVACEQMFISNLWGIKDKDWTLLEQTTVTEKTKTYDMVQVEIPKTSEKHFYYFDVSRYLKKKRSKTQDEDVGNEPEPPTPNEIQKPAAETQQPQQTQEPQNTQPLQETPGTK
jgi:hypothetical protein